MIGPLGTGKTINTKCEDAPIPEFPSLLFGKHFDKSLFDATSYLKEKSPDGTLSVADFFDKFAFQINAIANASSIPKDELVYTNNEGHQLIDESLCYPFLSYVDPQFCVYCYDTIGDLLANGFAVSDTSLVSLVRERMTPELFKQIWDGGERDT